MIEVGEYVRTDKGKIVKIDKEKINLQMLKFLDVEYGQIVKRSKNIIDLIEEDDIGIMLYRGLTFRKFITKDDILELKVGNYKLLKILTKEQFNDNCYVVEE